MTDKKQDEKSFDSSKINTQELQKYKQDYSEHSFKEKLRKYAKIIGVGAVYKVLQFIKCCSCGMFYRNLMCR